VKIASSILHRVYVLVVVVVLLTGAAPVRADDSPPSSGLPTDTPEEYTSLKRFPQNLGESFLALFSRKNIPPLLIGGAASGTFASFDADIRNGWSVQNGSSTVGDVGEIAGGLYVVAPAVAGLLIAGHYSNNDRFHSFTYSLAQGETIALGLVEGLKFAVGRPRPDGSDNRSFPSAHAASSFMIASLLYRYYGRTAGIIGYSAATFIAASRVRKDSHWASDVAAGATLGYIVGTSVTRRTGISLRVGKVTLSPVIDMHHRRYGFVLSRNLE
jgi:membrane-associated phospholipid phosphatase